MEDDSGSRPMPAVDRSGPFAQNAAQGESISNEDVHIERPHQAGPDLLGETPTVGEVYLRALGLASTAAPVTLVGERGTGKRTLAQHMHNASGRIGPFVQLDCDAIPSSSLEEEIFGVQPSARDGRCSSEGIWWRAEGGTLLLENLEILPLVAQQHLVETLASGTLRHCGATEGAPADVRLLCSEQVPLEVLLHRGKIRRALYDCLQGVSLTLPGLHERRADLPVLVQRLLTSFRQRTGLRVSHVSRPALDRLQAAPWSGNLTELRSVVEAAASNTQGETVGVEELPADLGRELSNERTSFDELAVMSYREAKERTIQEFESTYFAMLLDRTGGNVSEAARQAGLDRSNFRRALRRARVRGTRPTSKADAMSTVGRAGDESTSGNSVEALEPDESGELERVPMGLAKAGFSSEGNERGTSEIRELQHSERVMTGTKR